MRATGTTITKILPPVSQFARVQARFTRGNQTVLNTSIAVFERRLELRDSASACIRLYAMDGAKTS